MARPRIRAALVAGALLVTAVPFIAHAVAPRLTCGVKVTGRWERIPVSSFQPISGISGSTSDSVSAYTVDEQRSQNVAATNGYTVKLSTSHGCDWTNAYQLSPTPSTGQPFAGSISKIVSVALLGGRAMAAIQEGSGSTSRPHVVVSDSGGDGWVTRDTGLPAQGAPRLLRAASDGRTAYLTISPTATGGTDGGATTGIIPLPGGGPLGGTPTGFLYRTTDGGASWTLQTGATDLPAGGTGFSQLDIDPSDYNRLYGIVGGRLLTSRDGGGSFTSAPGSGFTAVAATGPSSLVAFNGSGGIRSANGGASYEAFAAPSNVTSAAAREGASELALETNGSLKLLDANGRLTSVPAATAARPGSLLGDRGPQASFHALSGHSLLRYVDPVQQGVTIPPLALGDLRVPPPTPGSVTPRTRNVRMEIGESAVEEFTLNLPKNPTPLDLFFLVDVSTGMGDYVEELKGKIRAIVSRLEATGLDLKVGVGIVGTGQHEKDRNQYPPSYVFAPEPDLNNPGQSKPGKRYVKPVLYKRLRAIGDTGPELQQAINRLALETAPPGYENREGQLVALKQVAQGDGQQTVLEQRSGLSIYRDLPPGQQAGFRGNPGVRRMVILASNEAFDAPYGTDEAPGSDPVNHDPKLDFGPTLSMLNAARIQVIGLTAGSSEAIGDLQKLARGTRTFAPPGGVSCGGDPVQELSAGDPLVCNNGDRFADVIIRVLAGLVDRQSVQVVPHRRTPVLGAFNGRALLGLNVKKPNQVPFQVRVSCIDVKPGTYAQDMDLVLRQTVVGRARVNVTCVKANAATRPRPVAITGGNPPPPPAQPIANVVPAVVPPAPAAQPQAQPQVQTQVQVQPLTAAAIQEQQELQLALALSGFLKDDDPAFNGGQQMAMVDRRKRDEVQAAGLLAFAIVTCAGFGLAGLRARPEVRVRRVR